MSSNNDDDDDNNSSSNNNNNNNNNTVIPRLTKFIRSGITFVSRNVVSRRFLWKIV